MPLNLCKIVSFVFFFFLLSPLVYAKDIATKIHADSMNYNAKNHYIEFDKNVFIERDNFYLWADTIIVHLVGNAPINTSNMQGMKDAKIQRIEARGKVSIEYMNNRGWCGKAIYDVEKNLLSMQEKPLLEEGSNSIQGDEIVYYLKENRSEIVGADNRVKAVFSGALQSNTDNATNE